MSLSSVRIPASPHPTRACGAAAPIAPWIRGIRGIRVPSSSVITAQDYSAL